MVGEEWGIRGGVKGTAGVGGEGAHLGELARVDGYLLLTTHYLLLATYLGELARVDGACGHEEACG